MWSRCFIGRRGCREGRYATRRTIEHRVKIAHALHYPWKGQSKRHVSSSEPLDGRPSPLAPLPLYERACDVPIVSRHDPELALAGKPRPQSHRAELPLAITPAVQIHNPSPYSALAHTR